MLTMWKASQRSPAKATETLKSIWKSVSSASKAEPAVNIAEREGVTRSTKPMLSVKPSEPEEPEDMEIISTSVADVNDTDVDQCGGTPSAEELCSVALPLKSFPKALALGKALRLKDDVLVGFIDLPSSSALQKIARQVIDNCWKESSEGEKEDRFAGFLSEYNIQDVRAGSAQISNRILSKTDLLEMCRHLNIRPSDILQSMKTSLNFPPHMIRRVAMKMLGEWVRQGGTRERLLEVSQAFRFNDAAVGIAEAMKGEPSYTPLISHGAINHKGGEITLEELGITISIPEEAIPKGMQSVVTLQVPTQDTPRIPLQMGEVLVSPIVECSLTQKLLKPAAVVVPHCTDHLEGKVDRKVFLYTKTGPTTFGRRNLSSGTLRGFAISNDKIKFRTHHVQVWALCTTDLRRIQFRCVSFEPLFMPSSRKPTLRVYVVHPYTDHIKDITRKEKSSSVPYCQVMKEFKFSLESKAGDLKICCKNGSKRAEGKVPIENLLRGKCSPVSFELQFSPDENGKKTVHFTILQGSSRRADKEFTTSIEVEPDYGVDNMDSQGRLQYVSDNLLDILTDIIRLPKDVQSLGYQLGFSYSTIDQYLDRAGLSLNHVSRSGFGEMLRDWRRRVRPSDQVDELHLAMRNAGLGHAAEVTMHEPSSTSKRHFERNKQAWEAKK